MKIQVFDACNNLLTTTYRTVVQKTLIFINLYSLFDAYVVNGSVSATNTLCAYFAELIRYCLMARKQRFTIFRGLF